MLDGINTIIFDLDGSLVDSMWMWKDIDIEYLARYGLTCPDDLQKNIEGMSFSETAQYFKDRFNLTDELDKIKSDWEEMSVSKYRHDVTLKPGALRLLNFCKSNKIHTGIATSNGKKMVDALIEGLNLEDLFEVVVTACEVAKGKPNPDVFLYVSDKLNVNSKNCLVFEDIPAGIIAGKRAGMRVCAVEDEYSIDMSEEKKQLADYYIKDFREVLI